MRKKVHVVIDRPLGSVHPEHDDIVYPVNYGYIPGTAAGDGEAQDVYVLGVDTPVSTFDGELIAVIYRKNDCENKWVAAVEGTSLTKAEIAQATYFMERYFDSEIVLLDEGGKHV